MKHIKPINENIKEEILTILGKNHKTPIAFSGIADNGNIKYEDVYGLYTYKNGVYCFKGGWDVDFDELTDKEKLKVLNMVKDKKYKLNPSLQ